MVGGREGETYTPTTEIITEGGVWGHRGALPQAVVGIRLVSLDSGIIATGRIVVVEEGSIAIRL